ncbi:MAG: ATP-binding protein [Bacteroidetes bacterium]|nr:ATP-binding protein [Bacteroidota bacterium]
MKFYNRENELALLDKIEKLSDGSAQMTFVVGRRRIGKTSLLMKATVDADYIYLFVAKKSEVLLCAEFVEEVKQKLNIPIFGEIKSFKDLFGFLMDLSKNRHFTLIIDEFQEFQSVNPSVYSEMQSIWDLNKEQSKLNLILCGSVYSMMTQIFENSKEPLFGRATQRIHLKAFDIPTLKEILSDYAPPYTHEDLLAFYLFTGGVAKYVELLVHAKAFTFEAMLHEIVAENSLFLEEGKNVLIDEFGKEYGNYFSILSLIASGKTSRVEIESIMEIQTGGFLDRLENEYGLIKKVRPILAKPNSRTLKYRIEDNFLKFWFRFIYQYRSAVEAGNLDYLKEIIRRDYSTFSGPILEKYFVEQLKAQKQYNNIGTYWERNNQNEIDIVAVNDLHKTVLFAEVKRNPNKISIEKLKEKSLVLASQFKDYQFNFMGFSIEKM